MPDAKKYLIEIKSGVISNKDFWVTSLNGTEGISELFQFNIELSTTSLTFDANKILGGEVGLYINNPNAKTGRSIHGHVNGFQFLGQDSGGIFRYRASIVPALWFAGLAEQTRTHVFEEKGVWDICSELLKNAPIKVVSSDNKITASNKITRTIIQYNESDLAFFLRFLSEAGVSFYFDHSDSEHKLVLFDSSAHCPTLGANILYDEHGSHAETETVVGWRMDYSCFVPNIEWKDYDAAKSDVVKSTDKATEYPSNLKTVSSARWAPPFAGLATKWDDKVSGQATTASDLLKFATGNYQDSQQSNFTAGFTESNCPRFYAGVRFGLEKAPDWLEGKDGWLVKRIYHQATDNDSDGSHYRNQIECISNNAKLKPAMIPAPQMLGNVIARVVETQYGQGAAGVQANYGRVKVKFPWEDKASHWLQVAQLFGGSEKSGAWFLPQMDDDVVVGFVSGALDRPIVIGTMHHQKTKFGPAFNDDSESAEPKQRMGLRHPAGHEISFTGSAEKKGEIYLSSTKDINRIAGDKETAKIETSQETLITSGDTRFFMDKDQVELSVGDSKITMKKNGDVTISCKNLTVDASGKIDMASKTDTTIDAGAGFTAKSKANTLIDAGANIDLKGKANATVQAGANLTAKGSVNAQVEGGVALTAKGGASATLQASGQTAVKGAIVMIN